MPVITLLLVAAKVLGIIDWQWRWVLAPLWVGALFTLCIVMFSAAMDWVDKRTEK